MAITHHYFVTWIIKLKIEQLKKLRVIKNELKIPD